MTKANFELLELIHKRGELSARDVGAIVNTSEFNLVDQFKYLLNERYIIKTVESERLFNDLFSTAEKYKVTEYGKSYIEERNCADRGKVIERTCLVIATIIAVLGFLNSIFGVVRV